MSRVFLFTFLIVLLIDQYTKHLFFVKPELLSCNTGVSFGIFASLPSWLLAGGLISLLGISVYILRGFVRTYPLPMGFFFGGGVGNIVDRIWLSCVRDWLPIPFIPVVNNFADWAIFAGVVIILVTELYVERRTAE